jgi:outer membrane scaffolding protein for murein synthesis (MipA/OmpV family)
MTAKTLTDSLPIDRFTVAALTASAIALFALAPAGAQETLTEQRTWRGSVGMVGGSVASYYGADARRNLGAPLLDLVYKNRILIGTSASSTLGAGVQWLATNGALSTAFGLAASESRPERRADALAGMESRGGNAFATATLTLRLGPALAQTTTSIGLDDESGNMQSFALRVGGTIAPRLTGSVGSAVTWADRRNMAFDFGITAREAERRQELIDAGDRRLRVGDAVTFTPGGGFKELRNTAQLAYAVLGGWQVVGVVSHGRLAHGVAESPLARKRSAVTMAAGLAYSF